jgi:lysophospholipase L1-like esterase
MVPRVFLPLILFILSSIITPLTGQRAADPDPSRFDDAISEFLKSDLQTPYPKGGIVFVGSSSIRRLSIPEVFPGLSALNRGFGGSQISDVNHFIEETVLKHEPKLVVIYCGSNDLWARKPALQVIEDFNQFTAALFSRLPESRLIVLASRPSPRRESILETELAFNYLLGLEAQKDDRIIYISGSSDRYFNTKGEFHQELFADDQLHMSEKGYEIWAELLNPFLR